MQVVANKNTHWHTRHNLLVGHLQLNENALVVATNVRATTAYRCINMIVGISSLLGLDWLDQ